MLLAGASSVSRLPLVRGQAEQDGLVTALLNNAGNGLGLLGNTRDGKTHGVTSLRPAGLQNDTGLALADIGNNFELALHELTSLRSISLSVEEGVGIGTRDINDTADSRREVALLPDVDSLGGGVRAGVAAEFTLALGDEAGKLGRLAVTVEDGLVTNGDEVNHIPLGPALDSADLLSDTGVASVTARGVNEDTKDHLQAVLLASRADVGESIAVSGVDTNGRNTGRGNGSNVLLNLGGALATTGLAGLIGSVRDTPRVASGATKTAGRLGLGSRGRSSRVRARLRDNRGGGNNGVGGRDSGGRGTRGRNVERAVNDRASLSDGGHNLRLGVGSSRVGGDDRDSDGRRLANGGCGRSNGVGTSGRADIGRSRNDAGGNTLARGDRGIRAGNSGGSGDDSRDTTDGVCTAGDGGSGGSAHSGGLSQSDSGGGEGVNTRGRARLSNWRGDDNGSRRDGLRGGRGRRQRSRRGGWHRSGRNRRERYCIAYIRT